MSTTDVISDELSASHISSSDSIEWDVCYELIMKLTREAGTLIRDRLWGDKDVELKSCDVDLVTETDQEVERMLMSTIQSNFPDHKFIAEEATAAGVQCELTDDPTWIIDPVDGTMNFVHGYPNVCISVALLVNKEAEIGIIYNPILELFFSARKGHGAYLNQRRIGVSEEKELSKALLGYEFGTSRDAEKMKVVMENMALLVPEVHGYVPYRVKETDSIYLRIV